MCGGAGVLGCRVPRHARRSPAKPLRGCLRGAAAHHRHDRHRQRARRPDVARPVPRLLESVRRGRTRRHHIDVAEDGAPARRHPVRPRRLRAGAAEPVEACPGLSGRRGPEEAGRDGPAGLRHGGGWRRQGDAGGRTHSSRGRPFRHAAVVGARLGRHEHAGAGARECPRDSPAGRAARPSCRRCGSTRSAIRTTPGRGCGGSSPSCVTWCRRRRRTAKRATSRRGPASAATVSTRMRPAPISRPSPTSGSTPMSEAKGPLGKLYPYPCCIHEGDTPSFLGLIDNGLASAMSPAYGGWGGRYVWRQPRAEPRAVLDAGRRFFRRAGQLSRHGGRLRRRVLHVRPGHDLAMAEGVPARLRRAHGLDGQGARRRQPQPARRRERPAGDRPSRARRAGGPAARARCRGDHRPGRAQGEVLVVLLP